MSKKIYLDAPFVGEEEKAYVCRAIDEGYVSSVGPFVSDFEKAFAVYCGASATVSVQSGTAALHMALRELGIGPGDEVIVPALTFVATANPIFYVGATPVIVDVELDTWNISPEQVKKYITERTKAIIPVHLYGNPCNMDVLCDIAREHNLYIIEDATEGLGARYNEKHMGLFGDFGCFSFNGNKMITTGSGGMIVGNDEERIKHMQYLVNQARDDSAEYFHSEVGYNYRLTNLQAALGLAQLSKLDNFLKKKLLFNKRYRELFVESTGVDFQQVYCNAQSAWWLTAILLPNNVVLKNIRNHAARAGIQTRRVFTPINLFPPYRQYAKGTYPNAYEIYERGVCLPSSINNEIEDLDRVVELVKQFL